MIKYQKQRIAMNLESLQDTIRQEVGVLLYFSGENCNVCHALRPKFQELFDTKFGAIKQIYLDAHDHPTISAHYQVFAVPTMLVFLDGREFVREGRAVSLYQLEAKLQRPYGMISQFQS
jgi:thioredoxin-like negative regulator of GroEL